MWIAAGRGLSKTAESSGVPPIMHFNRPSAGQRGWWNLRSINVLQEFSCFKSTDGSAS
jgi:hypothetical protein